MTNHRLFALNAVTRQVMRAGVGFLFLVLAGVFLHGTAFAEPYMTVREGYKCSKCHVNKTGGGMRTDYAKAYMETRGSMWPGLGPTVERQGQTSPRSDFASGRLSPTFSVGADLRADYTYTDWDNAPRTTEFDHAASSPDCTSCHNSASGGGKRAEIYARMELEPDYAELVFSQSMTPTVAPREVYGLLNVLPWNGYVKAGTFRLPTALNNTFDEPFLHTNQKWGATVPTLETVRGTGVEVGVQPGPFFVALSMTNPQDLTKNPSAKRVHLSGYAVAGPGLLGLTYYQDPIDEAAKEQRTLNGVYTGLSLGRFTGLLEVDNLTTKLTAGETKQQALLAELDVLVTRGQNLKLQYEAFDPDTTVKEDIRDCTSLVYEPFLTPYLQVRVGGRVYAGPAPVDKTVADTNNGDQYFVELHLLY